MAIDESLVVATQSGDRTAFQGIYETYYDRIYRYALVRLGNAADAEDVASEVFLRALESIHTYSLRGLPFAAWLFRIAHNLVVDHGRRRSRRPTSELDDSLPLTQDDPESEVMSALAFKDVLKALEQVTDAQRQVIALRFAAGLSVAETAEAMKKNQNAVKVLQHSAIGALRRRLARQGHEIPS